MEAKTVRSGRPSVSLLSGSHASQAASLIRTSWALLGSQRLHQQSVPGFAMGSSWLSRFAGVDTSSGSVTAFCAQKRKRVST